MRHLLKSSEFRITLAAIVIFLVFGLRRPDFFTEIIWRGILRAAGDLGLVLLGEAIVITVGEIDLSVASTWALCAYIFLVLANGGVDPMLALVMVLLLGALIGSVNGLLVTKTGAPSFLVTLASMWIIRGILLMISVTTYVYLRVNTFLDSFLQGYFGPVPGVFLWFIVFTAAFTVLLTRTRFGNHVLAVGGNLTVARNIGVRIERTKILCFMLSSLMAAVTAVFFFNRQFYVASDVMVEAPLFAICACVIGGCRAGYANILGTALGVLIIIVIQRGTAMAGIPATLYMAVVGLILLIFATIHIKAKGIHWLGGRT